MVIARKSIENTLHLKSQRKIPLTSYKIIHGQTTSIFLNAASIQLKNTLPEGRCSRVKGRGLLTTPPVNSEQHLFWSRLLSFSAETLDLYSRGHQVCYHCPSIRCKLKAFLLWDNFKAIYCKKVRQFYFVYYFITIFPWCKEPLIIKNAPWKTLWSLCISGWLPEFSSTFPSRQRLWFRSYFPRLRVFRLNRAKDGRYHIFRTTRSASCTRGQLPGPRFPDWRITHVYHVTTVLDKCNVDRTSFIWLWLLKVPKKTAF